MNTVSPAREFGITPRAIRFYEEKGLLSPQRNGSARIFNAADRVRLVLILRGKRIGFSLEESRDIIDMYEPETANTHQLESLLNKLHEKRLLLERQKKEINVMIRDLKNRKHLSQGIKGFREQMSPLSARKKVG